MRFGWAYWVGCTEIGGGGGDKASARDGRWGFVWAGWGARAGDSSRRRP